VTRKLRLVLAALVAFVTLGGSVGRQITNNDDQLSIRPSASVRSNR
jgi:hypothetical protein